MNSRHRTEEFSVFCTAHLIRPVGDYNGQSDIMKKNSGSRLSRFADAERDVCIAEPLAERKARVVLKRRSSPFPGAT
ncbi:hypothetical protein [Massilia sp. WF1]|uniref:hypothetical protein n=1 Tax=Massilia sp. WF1 TaxID=1406431 RepID=UPI0012E1DAC2|nr:hypothetical protein [Massilia sp. WF1]